MAAWWSVLLDLWDGVVDGCGEGGGEVDRALADLEIFAACLCVRTVPGAGGVHIIGIRQCLR